MKGIKSSLCCQCWKMHSICEAFLTQVEKGNLISMFLNFFQSTSSTFQACESTFEAKLDTWPPRPWPCEHWDVQVLQSIWKRIWNSYYSKLLTIRKFKYSCNSMQCLTSTVTKLWISQLLSGACLRYRKIGRPRYLIWHFVASRLAFCCYTRPLLGSFRLISKPVICK